MSSDNLLNPDAFWQFSCELYARPEVKQRCLAVQDKLQLNVNILLLCQWLAGHGKSLSVNDFSHLRAEIAASEDQLRSLRQQRSNLNKGSTEYRNVLHKELEWEMAQQRRLIAALAELDPLISSEHCLFNYIQSCDVARTSELEQLKLVLEQTSV